MTHLDDLHALLSERAHLRAQRDELQATCTRLEAEARAAREEMRRVRAKQPSVGDILHGTAILGRRVTIPGVGSGRIISFSAYGDDEAGCQIRLDGRRGVRPDVPAKDLRIEDEPAAITPPAEQGDIANRTTVADMLKDNNSPVGRRVQITVNGPRLGTVLAMQERATGNVCIVQTGEGAFEMHEPHTLVDAEPLDAPAPEEKPAYVARWVLDSAPETWKLVTDKQVVATLRRRDIGDRGYGVTVKHPSAVWNTKHERADFGEYEARQLGWLPPGPVDRSQLDDYE